MNLSVAILCLILTGPFLSFLVSSTLPRKYSSLVPVIASACLFVSVAGGIFLAATMEKSTMHFVFHWFSAGSKPVLIGFLIDQYAASMIVTVSLVSFLVHLYSIRYMAGDDKIKRYFAMLGLFTWAMLGIVMSSSLLVTFCFWELVGFSSYQLIGHWYEKPEASAAATKAFIMNRMGDLGFIVGLMIIWSFAGDFDILALRQASLSLTWQTAASLCIFLGILGKSAQFPLFTWLPDAMEGPTPVSALIHAATMVAAGVFLLFRLNFFFTPDALAVVAVVGSLTAVMAALAALFQYDIKRILAYSTISQLGFMVMAMVADQGIGGFHHLLNHAFFKAGLFLCAGSIINALHHVHTSDGKWDVQDIRNLGGLRQLLPITFYCFVICAAALAGIPFTSGFVSKEIILTDLSNWAAAGSAWRWLIPCAGWVVTFLTPLYSFRLLYYIFLGDQNNRCSSAQESSWIMLVPMIVLSIWSLAVTLGVHYSLSGWILSSSPSAVQWIVFASTLLISISIVVGYFLYKNKPSTHYGEFLTQNFLLDRLYKMTVIKPTQIIAAASNLVDSKILDRILHLIVYAQVGFSHLVAWSDKVLVDGLVNGMAYMAATVGSATRSMAGGKIQSYLLWAMAGLVIFIALILF